MRSRFVSLLLIGTLGIPVPLLGAEEAGGDVVRYEFSEEESAPEWRTLNDRIMGGRSSGSFEPVEGAMRFAGSLSQDNRGGFASIQDEDQLRDLSGTDGFELKVLGDGREYSLMVWTDDAPNRIYYGADFTPAAGEWQVIQLRWSDFRSYYRGFWVAQGEVNPARIVSIGFMIADGLSGPFALDLAWIRSLEIED
jgi:hypothetical protein